MKSVKEISDITGVSVQTVYRRLTKVKAKTSEVLTEKTDGMIYFTEIGEKLILEELNSVKQMENTEILYLREQNKLLTEKLASLAEDLARLTENSQVLLREQNLKALSPPPDKFSLWSIIFKRKG